jgi:hypothetical protein
MANFDALESSLELSRPIEVYKFALGGTTFLYTSAEDEITLTPDTYVPEAISRNSIAQGQDDRRRVLDITVPSSNAFAAKYKVTPPGQKATLSIIRLQRDETPTFNTQELIYKGSVQSVQFPDAGETAKISVQSIEAASSRVIPRVTFIGQCNHVLYDAGCGVDPSLFDFLGTVSTVSGNDITLTGAGASGIDFVGGYCKPTAASDFRLILAQSGDVLTLMLPFESDVTGANVQAFAGCDHNIEGDCALVFDNIAENASFSFVPNKNPFATGLD